MEMESETIRNIQTLENFYGETEDENVKCLKKKTRKN